MKSFARKSFCLSAAWSVARPLAALLVGSFGCGDDTTVGTGGAGGATSSSDASSNASSSVSGSGSPQGTGGDGGSGDGGNAETTGGTGGAGGDGTGGTGGEAAFDCDDLPAGPFEPTLFYDGFDGSEDIAFDGLGHLAGKQGAALILVDAELNETVLFDDDLSDAFGTRFAPDGSIVVALPGVGEVVKIDVDGSANVLADDFSGPNGIHITMDGTVWVTELPAGRIQTIAPGAGFGEPFLPAGEAPAANGVYVDEDRGIVFYTNYSAGEVWRVDVDGATDPQQVASVDGAALDGLTMDVCGNIYAVDQGNSVVYRVRTDASGDLVGEPERIADLPTGVANAQFGRGSGFSSTTLYAAGSPGDVYAIEVGVAGAPQAGP